MDVYINLTMFKLLWRTLPYQFSLYTHYYYDRYNINNNGHMMMITWIWLLAICLPFGLSILFTSYDSNTMCTHPLLYFSQLILSIVPMRLLLSQLDEGYETTDHKRIITIAIILW